MNIFLWIVQGLLGIGFIYSGWLKAFQFEAAQASWQWVSDIPSELAFVIGIVEIIGAIGLILPQTIKVYPQLSVLAGLSLSVVVLSGGIFHNIRGKFEDIIVNLDRLPPDLSH
ncbi:DoxX family protein [Bacillus sp. A116_S68]|nr:DoxX family protein [Bacillus sp. A116_S68]